MKRVKVLKQLNVLDTPLKAARLDFFDRVRAVGADLDEVKRGLTSRIALRTDQNEVDPLDEPEVRRWVESLRAGEPDFDTYGSDFYLGVLWNCWTGFSRQVVRMIRRKWTLPNPRVVVDLGNGIGYSSAGLAEIFPRARVVGTNFPNLNQVRIARSLGVEVVGDAEEVGETADVVVASEYFEHFERPAEHLREVLSVLRPTYLVVINSFTYLTYGHYERYEIDGRVLEPRATSRAFNAVVRAEGFRKVDLGFWNNRPMVWSRAGGRRRGGEVGE